MKLNLVKKKIVDALVSHPNATTIGTGLAVAADITVAAEFASLGVQMVHASIGNCGSCAFSFTPNSLSSSLQGTSQHGVQHIFAPGQEAQASKELSASSFAPGQAKP